MKCHVDGCGREVRYLEKQVCQMHYFRMMRNGSYELKPRTKVQRIVMPGRGYIRVFDPLHPLRDSLGYVAEHRKIVYARYGENLPACEICGKPTQWQTCHIDHIDRDVKNNDVANLRPLCAGCNTWRDMPPHHTFPRCYSLTFQGKTATPHEWSRDPRVQISGSQIKLRKKAGMSDEDALFAPKITHNGKVPTKKPVPPKHTRRNAIRVTIDGQMMTAAEWSRHPKCPVSEGTIISRVRAGWPHRLAVFTPAKASAERETG